MPKELELNEVNTDRLKLILKIATYHINMMTGNQRRHEVTGETMIFLQRLREDLHDKRRVHIIMLEE